MSGLKFLLLEDSLLDTELIRAILSEGGISYELVSVKTQTEFQTVLELECFDLILSDYSLPGFDGISALEMAQHFCPDVPFIFVTATMGEEVAIETLKSGATDYVLKQRLERLVPSVRRALREAEERRARQKAEAELRQQKEQLERANQIKDEFLAVLSHELRSPLNAILGWSKLLRTQNLDETTILRALETIERNARLQTQLIEDLLDVSRILRGKLTLHPYPTDLISTIEAAIDTMRLAAQAKSLDLQFTILDCGLENNISLNNYSIADNQNTNLKSKIQNPKFLVLGDPNRLQQIIWNLLSNAIKFTPQGGRVEVLLEQVDTCARITVTDTGDGIKKEFLPYVFDSFRQADGSTTRRYGGLGLGLAIVRHLVELHGGTVSASSLGEGQGATFTVQIPIIQRSREKYFQGIVPNPQPSILNPQPPLAGVRILVVDDDGDSRDFIMYALEDCGAIAYQATSAISALELLASFKPDVLISDIGMPDLDGHSLIRQIRTLPSERGGQIPAIALTAYAGESDRTEAIASGFQKHLSKPVMPDELANAVIELLSTSP